MSPPGPRFRADPGVGLVQHVPPGAGSVRKALVAEEATGVLRAPEKMTTKNGQNAYQ